MRFETPQGSLEVGLCAAVVAGWTGRDLAAVEHHIAELAEIGVPPPSRVPLYYRVSSSLLTQSAVIEVLGNGTSGEVEPLVLRWEGRLWLGLASDHTDRDLESVSVAASKQMCAKPVGHALWPLEDVAPHLDRIELTCEIDENGAWTLYQRGTLADIRPLSDLVEGAELEDGAAMLCGTLGAIGGVRPAASYRMTLNDPVLSRQLDLVYRVETLPIIS